MSQKLVRYYRKIIKIKATDSPNVRYALALQARGIKPDGELIVPGVLPWSDYNKRRLTWDAIRQCVSLDAEFYEGSEVLLYPPDWLNRAEEIARKLARLNRKARALGCDPGEGGDDTSWAVVDEYGLIKLEAFKTPNTSLIVNKTIDLIKRYNLDCDFVCLDTGGGGKQIADRLRDMGYPVKTVAFGAAPTGELRQTKVSPPYEDRVEDKETRTTYKNRRAQMYGEFSALLDPALNPMGWGIPEEYTELRRQLAPMPKLFDGDGKMYMLPKDKKDPKSKERTLKELLGCSPDEADSVVIARHIMVNATTQPYAGAF